MHATVKLEEFVLQAGDRGPCVGLRPATPSPLARVAGVELRTVDGARTKTLDFLFGAFAEVWQFPPSFGHNMNAFDDFMRDFQNIVHTATGKPPAQGYVTVITDAHLLLAEQPEDFPWFANSIPFYRDYYRDEASPPAAFGLLLSAPTGQLHEIRERWVTAGIQLTTIVA